jgi:hypothetical protein
MKKGISTIFILMNLFIISGLAQFAPAKITAPLIAKVLPFEKNISANGDIKIHVFADADVQSELEKTVGMSVGKVKISEITTGGNINGAKVVVVDDPSQVEKVKKYCRENNALSITRDVNLLKDGITLCIAISSGKPKLIINLSASNEEGLTWNPALFKIAEKLD